MTNKENDSYAIHNQQTVIPTVFYSDVTGEPFKACVICEKYLYEPGAPYLIEKAFRRNKKFNITETLFEYAICAGCYEKMSVKFSRDSATRLEMYFRDNANLYTRINDLSNNNNLSVDDWLSHCAVKGTDIKECNEYQICCQCDGPHMLFAGLPMAISDEALMEISELLSPETKDELDRFKDDFLGLPPDLKELFRDRSFVLV